MDAISYKGPVLTGLMGRTPRPHGSGSRKTVFTPEMLLREVPPDDPSRPETPEEKATRRMPGPWDKPFMGIRADPPWWDRKEEEQSVVEKYCKF